MKKFNLYDIVIKDKESKDSPALSSYLVSQDEKVEFLSTNVMTLNILFSGRIDGGIPKGRISMISAPSMMGKSFVAYGLIKNAQLKDMQVCVIDTERAFSFETAKKVGVDVSTDKLVVLQENGIEEVSGIIATICNEVPKTERKNILFVIDSWGALVTSKTMNNALVGNDAADFTIPKKKNNLSNIILNTKATYFIVNHIYDTMESHGDSLAIPGGRKVIFNSDCIVLGKSRAKEKQSTSDPTIIGHIITAETFKSRWSKEKSKLQFRIKYTGGLDIFYGLLDDAIEAGVVDIPSQGFYNRPTINPEEKVREKNIYNSDFWLPIFKQTTFKQWLQEKYTFNSEMDVATNSDTMDLMNNKQIDEIIQDNKSKK